MVTVGDREAPIPHSGCRCVEAIGALMRQEVCVGSVFGGRSARTWGPLGTSYSHAHTFTRLSTNAKANLCPDRERRRASAKWINVVSARDIILC